MMDAKIEQYKILWTAFENEMGRFWQRFNILISIQLIAISLFKLTDNGIVNPIVSIFLFFILSLFSFITFLIVTRAITIYKFNLKKIEEFEIDNTEFTILTKDNVTDFLRPLAYYYAIILPIVLFLAWSVAMFYQITIVFN